MGKLNENLTFTEMEQLKLADTPKKWLRVHDGILASRGGQYPPDWQEKTKELFLKLVENL